MLTPKQEKFAQCVADGMSQADAYRSAFDAVKMKAETIHKRASELMGNGEVTGRVQELRAKLENKALWTREMSVRALVAAYKMAQGANSASGMTAAVKELNAMHGFNEPIKHHITANVSTIDPTKLSSAARRELLEARGCN
jgi:phage terminase small subunit